MIRYGYEMDDNIVLLEAMYCKLILLFSNIAANMKNEFRESILYKAARFAKLFSNTVLMNVLKIEAQSHAVYVVCLIVHNIITLLLTVTMLLRLHTICIIEYS